MEKIVFQLEEYFYGDFETEESQKSIALFGGRSGTLLLNSILCLNNSKLDREVYIDKNIEFIMGVLEAEPQLHTSHSSGLSGLGYCLDFIQKNSLSAYCLNDLLKEIDFSVKKHIHEYIQRDDYDLLHGALGVGCYLMFRESHLREVEFLVQALENSLVKDIDGIRWKQFDEFRSGEYVYDFGLAHGNAGILYFLAKAYQLGIRKQACKNLIRGLIKFYKSNLQNPQEVGSYFPNFKEVDKYDKNSLFARSRLAWCYGDLGILHTFFLVSKIIGDASLEYFAINLLKEVSKRCNYKETLVSDAGFCHGSSGAAYIFHKMFRATNEEAFKTSSDYWHKVTLDYTQVNSSKISGNFFKITEQSKGSNHLSLLDGVAGIAIVLSSQSKKSHESDWDYIFFLS